MYDIYSHYILSIHPIDFVFYLRWISLPWIGQLEKKKDYNEIFETLFWLHVFSFPNLSFKLYFQSNKRVKNNRLTLNFNYNIIWHLMVSTIIVLFFHCKCWHERCRFYKWLLHFLISNRLNQFMIIRLAFDRKRIRKLFWIIPMSLVLSHFLLCTI